MASYCCERSMLGKKRGAVLIIFFVLKSFCCSPLYFWKVVRLWHVLLCARDLLLMDTKAHHDSGWRYNTLPHANSHFSRHFTFQFEYLTQSYTARAANYTN